MPLINRMSIPGTPKLVLDVVFQHLALFSLDILEELAIPALQGVLLDPRLYAPLAPFKPIVELLQLNLVGDRGVISSLVFDIDGEGRSHFEILVIA